MNFLGGDIYPFGTEIKISHDHGLLQGTGLSVEDIGRFCIATRQDSGFVWKNNTYSATFAGDVKCFILWNKERLYINEFSLGVDGLYFGNIHKDISQKICDMYSMSTIPLSRCCWLPPQLIQPTWNPNVGDKVLYGGDTVTIVAITGSYVNPQGMSYLGGITIQHNADVLMVNAHEVSPLGSGECDHEFVNVGFTSLKMVCKKCDMERAS